MARLQDFQPVTPTDSDNLLVVQATGQGLATFGSTLGAKLDKANPTGTGYFSLNRKANTTVGQYSTAEGQDCEASGTWAHAEGYNTVASRGWSHAENIETTASGTASHAEGSGTIANHHAQHVFGTYNVADTSTSEGNTNGNFVEIVGNGTGNNSRSNARTLDWNGNEVLAGGLKINGSEDVATKPKRIAFSGTTSSNGNINLGSYVAATEVIVAMTAREVNNTSNLFVCIPYQYSGSDYGFCRGAHLISETLTGSAASKNIEGYIWTMPFRTS